MTENLLDLPDCVLESLLENYLSYDEISKSRIVSKRNLKWLVIPNFLTSKKNFYQRICFKFLLHFFDNCLKLEILVFPGFFKVKKISLSSPGSFIV